MPDVFNISKILLKKNHSQHVFLKGWKNRANRLNTLVKEQNISPQLLTDTVHDLDTTQTILINLLETTSVTRTDIKKMIDYQKEYKPDTNPRYWAVFKIAEHSKNKRLYVFDRLDQKVQAYYATHGKNSDPDNDGLATEFSNEVNSLKSSIGLYRTWETYTMNKHGTALRLDGLEHTNSRARERGIVFHGVPYAGDAYVKIHDKCGRSHGCPAVDYSVSQMLIKQLKGGSLLLITNQ